MISITKESIDNLVAAAASSPRKRMNLNIHKSLDARVQRFFNAMERQAAQARPEWKVRAVPMLKGERRSYNF